MGCDIHLYVEKFQLTGPGEEPGPNQGPNGPSMDRLNRTGTWVSADTWVPNEYYKPDDPDYANEPSHTVDYGKRFYSARNYDLFAILADVRNGHGFAGVDTGEGFVPIDSPRGLPVDVCPQVQAESDRWDCDGHSHSWFMLHELLTYDWLQTTKHRGMLHASQYLEWSWYRRFEGDGPESWSGGIYMRDGVTHPSMADMDQFLIDTWLKTATVEQQAALVDAGDNLWHKLRVIGRDDKFLERTKKELNNHIVQVEWEETYVDSASTSG